MFRRFAICFFVFFGCGNAFADVTLDWGRADEWRILCQMDQRCVAGRLCVSEKLVIEVIYRPQDETASQILGGSQRKAIPFIDKGRPRSRARSFLFQLDQGAAGLFTIFHSGGAVYSIQYEGSPAGGQMWFGDCSVRAIGEELDL